MTKKRTRVDGAFTREDAQKLKSLHEVEELRAMRKNLIAAKSKTLAQQKQAKKDMQKSYNETLKHLQEEVDQAITDLDLLLERERELEGNALLGKAMPDRATTGLPEKLGGLSL